MFEYGSEKMKYFWKPILYEKGFVDLKCYSSF